MSHSPGGRESPSSTASSTTASGSGSVIGSVGSGSNGCRNSGASFDSGRATSTTFQGVRYSAGGLSSESSLGSFRHSYHSSSSSLGSIPSEEIRNFDVAAMISQGVPDHEILNAWLTGIHLECYYQNFIQAGYDMHTISRMTPEDLNAIGVTKPHHRKKIKSEISQLNISDGLPEYIPESIDDWLRLLRLEDYLHKLKEQGYQNVRQVTNITWEDLEDIGILKLGHQKKFMLAIKRVQDILSGKRVPSSCVPNAYLTPMESFPISQAQQQQPLRHAPGSMPYHQNTSTQSIGHPFNSQHHHQYQLAATINPHHIQRNVWPQAHQNSPVQTPGISHKIQVHTPPTPPHERMTPEGVQHPVKQAEQPLYHPEVISIRVRNGHGNKSLDSPPEEEPIYGTSSFLPSQVGSTSSPWQKGIQPFKSFEEGETTPTNGYGNNTIIGNGSNLAMTKHTMSNTWTLPRLQKNKPISKVMGGGTNSNSSSCDSSVSYPINPGPFAPQQLNPSGSTPSVSTFVKPSDYGTIKNGPPPPPRRSSCASLSHMQQLDEDNLPLPPPPQVDDSMSTGSPVLVQSASNSKPTFTFVNESYKTYGMSASYYGQRSSNLNSYQSPPDTNVPNGNGTGGFRSTLPIMSKSRDPSPVGGEFSSDADILSNNGLLSKGVKRNGSDASFKSNSSTESESIPFANDNAGTIKQQKPANRTTQGGGIVVGGVASGPSQQTIEAGDVLSDIGSMLADLTDQLDAILEQERSSKH